MVYIPQALGLWITTMLESYCFEVATRKAFPVIVLFIDRGGQPQPSSLNLARLFVLSYLCRACAQSLLQKGKKGCYGSPPLSAAIKKA